MSRSSPPPTSDFRAEVAKIKAEDESRRQAEAARFQAEQERRERENRDAEEAAFRERTAEFARHQKDLSDVKATLLPLLKGIAEEEGQGNMAWYVAESGLEESSSPDPISKFMTDASHRIQGTSNARARESFIVAVFEGRSTWKKLTIAVRTKRGENESPKTSYEVIAANRHSFDNLDALTRALPRIYIDGLSERVSIQDCRLLGIHPRYHTEHFAYAAIVHFVVTGAAKGSFGPAAAIILPCFAAAVLYGVLQCFYPARKVDLPKSQFKDHVLGILGGFAFLQCVGLVFAALANIDNFGELHPAVALMFFYHAGVAAFAGWIYRDRSRAYDVLNNRASSDEMPPAAQSKSRKSSKSPNRGADSIQTPREERRKAYEAAVRKASESESSSS